MKTETTTCDACGRDLAEGSAFIKKGNYRLTLQGSRASTAGMILITQLNASTPTYWRQMDFCNLDCVAKWIEVGYALVDRGAWLDENDPSTRYFQTLGSPKEPK